MAAIAAGNEMRIGEILVVALVALTVGERRTIQVHVMLPAARNTASPAAVSHFIVRPKRGYVSRDTFFSDALSGRRRLRHHEKQAAKLIEDMKHVEAVLHLLEPGFNARAMSVKRRSKPPVQARLYHPGRH